MTVRQAFAIWDDLDACPYCGSDEIEYDLNAGTVFCNECGEESAEILTDDMERETWIINNLDRFDFLDIFLRERPGGEE